MPCVALAYRGAVEVNHIIINPEGIVIKELSWKLSKPSAILIIITMPISYSSMTSPKTYLERFTHARFEQVTLTVKVALSSSIGYNPANSSVFSADLNDLNDSD